MSSISFRSEPRLACVISVQSQVHCSSLQEETTRPTADDDISEDIIDETQKQEKSQEE